MPDIRELLDREVAHLAPPDALEPVRRRAGQRHRRRRLGAALVAFVVALAGTAGVWLVANAIRNDGPRPAGTGWDGGRIVYECRDVAFSIARPTLCTMRSDGTDRRVIVPTPAPGDALPTSMSSPGWSPDGSRIAFRGSWKADCELCWDLYVMNADGSDLHRVTLGGVNAVDPVWSPDGSWIAFGTGIRGTIMKMRADGTGLTTLRPSVPPSVSAGFPTWSADGTRLAFAGLDTDTARSDLYVMNADGSGAHVVVPSSDAWGKQIAQPAWSPDGRIIAFAAFDSDHRPAIWAWDAAPALDGDPKNQPWRLTAPESHPDMGPKWIDGGAQVAFVHEAAGGPVLEAVRVDGGGGSEPGSDPVGVPEGSPYRTTLATGFTEGLGSEFPSSPFAIQPPPGGAAGACVDPGPPAFISCSEALQRVAQDRGGAQGSSVDVRLVQGAVQHDGAVDPADDRWVWAVIYRDIDALNGGPSPVPQRIDWETDVDARTGAFVSEGIARAGA